MLRIGLYHKIKVFILFIFLLSSHTILANQFEYQFKNYRFNEGLPSCQVFEIIQDKAGFIWFGTDRGLVRYNGYEFKVFTVEDGLSTNVIFKLDEDDEGRICCFGIDRKIHIFNGNRFFEYKYNSLLREKLSINSHLLRFEFDENGFTFSSTDIEKDASTYGNLSKDGRWTLSNLNGINLYSTGEGFIGVKNTHYCEAVYLDGKFLGNIDFETIRNLNFATAKEDGKWIYFSVAKSLFRVDLENENCIEKINDFSEEILDIQIDDKGSIYLGFRHDGLWKMQDGDPSKLSCMLAEHSVPSILIDRQNDIWASSLYNGLFYCDNSNNRNLRLTNEDIVHRLIKDNDKLHLITEKEKLISVEYNDSFPIIKENYIKLKTYPEKSSSSLVNKGLFLNKETNKYFVYGLSIKEYLKIENKFVVVSRNRITAYNSVNEKAPIFQFALTFNTYINCAARVGNGFILLGTNEGIKIISDSMKMIDHLNTDVKGDSLIEDFEYANSFFRSKMHCILNHGDSLMFFGSGEKGLMIREKGKPDRYLSKKDGLISDAIEQLYYEDGLLVVASNEGISVITDEEGIVNYTWKNGLLSNNVFDVVLYDDKLWVATDLGLSILENKKPISYDIPVSLSRVEINMEEQNLSNIYELNNDQRYMEISFQGLCFSQEGEINYKYQLKGVDDGWIETPYPRVRYANLPYGTFPFSIMTQKKDLSWSIPIQLFQLNKAKPFWKTGIFYGLVSLLILGLIYAAFNWRFERLRRIEEDKFLILNLERKTLQAQIHPHFVFNSLTSLQSLIIDDKKYESQEYLGKFSKLTRMALQHSTKNMISLKEEIHMLRLFMDLECIRYIHKFEYQINCEINESEYEISPMLIQPFVENAIKHGFSNKKEGGMLNITFRKRDESTFLCTVTDNGLGRNLSRALSKNQESLGIRLVKDRLNILLKKSQTELIKIKDLYENKRPIGTSIEIILPFKRVKI